MTDSNRGLAGATAETVVPRWIEPTELQDINQRLARAHMFNVRLQAEIILDDYGWRIMTDQDSHPLCRRGWCLCQRGGQFGYLYRPKDAGLSLRFNLIESVIQ